MVELGMPQVGGTVLLADPRGYCAGVDRAVITVEKALDLYGAPVYVRKQIVHNKHVVHNLAARGAIFVEELDEVPEGATVVFSAHGVSPAVHQQAADRRLKTIDATCPLVTKVHHEARRFAKDGYHILLIGHDGHEEVEGTAGEAPESITLVERPEDVDLLNFPPDAKLSWLSQTTLSVDETMETVRRLRERFPQLEDPPSDDICYATQNRQVAVKQIAAEADLVIVVGSSNSSNSVRLVEVALEAGAKAAHRIDDVTELQPEWLDGVERIGVTSGASVPDDLVQDVLVYLAENGHPATGVDFVRRAYERAALRAERDGLAATFLTCNLLELRSALGTAALIAAAAPESWVSRMLSAPPLVATGVLSYGLYLWHYPAAVFFRDRLPWFESVPLVLAIAFLAATMSHLLIERPLQGFRRNLKLAPSAAGIMDADAAPAAASSR